jgi:hypothetical protein
LNEFYELLCGVFGSLGNLIQNEDYILWRWVKEYKKRFGLMWGDLNSKLTRPNLQKEAPGPHSLQKASKTNTCINSQEVLTATFKAMTTTSDSQCVALGLRVGVAVYYVF